MKKLDQRITKTRSGSPAVRTQSAKRKSPAPPPRPNSFARELRTRYEILITCDNEAQQVALLQRFADEGLKCRALVV